MQSRKAKAFALVAVLALTGCATTIRDWARDRWCQSEQEQGLTNPAVPDGPGRVQEWYWARKDYDGSFRVRWPTYFADVAGNGSYTMINEHRAEFRGYWTDQPEARRPSYTMPIRDLPSEVLCVLYSSEDKPLAWFRTATVGAHRGTLPEGTIDL